MRKYLLPKDGSFFKANLHSHTNFSDGARSPEEVKELYKSRGYSVVAFTDHDALWSQYDKLWDEDFLPLTGYEMSLSDTFEPFDYKVSMHLNFFAPSPNKTEMPFLCQKGLDWLVDKKFITQELADTAKADGIYTDSDLLYAARVNEVLRVANEKGFLVSFNHPTWSLFNKAEYLQYDGFWGVEVFNNSCFVECGYGDDERVYDDILRSGRKIFPLCTDDSHFKRPTDSVYCDGFGGWVMIKADKLEYSSIFDALKKGDFYASTGPEITELYYEDGRIHIECSEAREIIMNCLSRKGARAAEKDGYVTSADFTIDPEAYGYVRFKVIDKNGRAAYTAPYYVDELIEGAPKFRAIL